MKLPHLAPLLVALAPATVAQVATNRPVPRVEPGVSVCFGEDADPAWVAAVYAANPHLKYNLTSRWPGTQGSPTTLTWSLIPDGVVLPGNQGEPASACNLFATLDAKFGDRAAWILRFQQSFDRWSELSGLEFQRITVGGNDWDDGAAFGANGSATRGDIRIGMHLIGAANPGLLAYARFPNLSNPGDIIMDSAENWEGPASQNRFLRNVIMHELGHSIGLLHVCSTTHSFLMEPLLSGGGADGPQHDEIRAVQRHYGDPHEPDDGAATATDLGILNGPTLTLGLPLPAPPAGGNPIASATLSLDANGEQDWFRLHVNSPSSFVGRLVPLGFAYDDQDQLGNGDCPAGLVTTDSLAVQNLSFELRAGDGLTVLALGNTAGAGKDENLAVPMLAPGTYYVRVYESGSSNLDQQYALQLTGRGRPLLEALLPATVVTLLLP